jgi:chaperonin cofactor prefoldin
VSAENVLRVVNGHPVSSDISTRVGAAIEELGPPTSSSTAVEPAESVRNQLFENIARATAELESSVPREVGSLVVEALRVEVRPVTERMETMGLLIEEIAEAWKDLRSQVTSERKERLEDVELMVELMTTGWRSVDRRLGRVEKMLERLERGSNGTHPERRGLA